MAHYWTLRIQGLRLLLVTALTLGLLSSPFLGEADEWKRSEAAITEVSDSIAGLSSEIRLQADSSEPLEVRVMQPDGDELILQAFTDKNGFASLALSDYHLREAGTYTVAARHIDRDESFGENAHFTVRASHFSSEASHVELSQKTASVGDEIHINVQVRDDYGNPIEGHLIKVLADKSALKLNAPSLTSDEMGHIEFSLSADEKVFAQLNIVNASVDRSLGDEFSIAFLEDDTPSIGGSDYVVLSNEDSGPIKGFRINGLDDEVESGDELSLSVTAIDEDGLTVSDYTGTVRFSSTDDEAELPNDYTFLAEDLGEHTFSLAFQFITSGEQSLTVTDIDQGLDGEATFEVLSDSNSDFESEDFERDGDFTLLSPASGSYSTDEIDIVGEGDYGYYAIIYLNDEEAGRAEIDFDNSFSYTAENLSDGNYEIYVEIADLTNNQTNIDDESILEVIESSSSENVIIDTTAPELVSIDTSPEDNIQTESTLLVTVLVEEKLDDSYLIFEDAVTELEGTSTSGKYQSQIVMPEEAGEYNLDLILSDELGNEVQYRDVLLIEVGEGTDSNTSSKDITSTENSTQNSSESSSTSTSSELDTPSGLNATAQEESVILTWETPFSENSIAYYRVYYGPSPSSLYAVSETQDSSTSWTITELIGDERYYFAVSAIDVEGNESASSEVAYAVPRLSKDNISSDDSEERPTGEEEEPAITESEEPPSTPDSGPVSTMMLLSSLGASAGYALSHRRARRRKF